MPATEVKVDRSFLATFGSGEAAAFVAGIVGLSHGLGLRVVAEGVETAAQLEALREIRCDRAQGYLLGRPAPAPVALEALRSWTHGLDAVPLG